MGDQSPFMGAARNCPGNCWTPLHHQNWQPCHCSGVCSQGLRPALGCRNSKQLEVPHSFLLFTAKHLPHRSLSQSQKGPGQQFPRTPNCPSTPVWLQTPFLGLCSEFILVSRDVFCSVLKDDKRRLLHLLVKFISLLSTCTILNSAALNSGLQDVLARSSRPYCLGSGK